MGRSEQTHEVEAHELLPAQARPELEVLNREALPEELGVESVDCLPLQLLDILQVGLTLVAWPILENHCHEATLLLGKRVGQAVDFRKLLLYLRYVLPASASAYMFSVDLNRCPMSTIR